MQNLQAAEAGLQSIPALLARNADRLGNMPAYREKEFGIWQSWTWADRRARSARLRWAF
jgi:long-chain acyl-CoA synthetase